MYIDTIPNFNTDSNTLETFLEHCESLLTTYANTQISNGPLNGFLITIIIGKLSGDALILMQHTRNKILSGT